MGIKCLSTRDFLSAELATPLGTTVSQLDDLDTDKSRQIQTDVVLRIYYCFPLFWLWGSI